MAERPSGTVTFLFTDIEGSTRRWEADATAMRVGLAAHDEVLRSAVEGRGGWLFKHTGDGVCAAFASATEAVAAAVDAQRRLGLPVRMGVVTGAAELRGDDYFGPVLNRAARVMAAAHGGQILLGTSTAGLADGADLVDLGVHRLRDLSGVEHLFQVRAEGLRLQFPALRTIEAVPGNLPVQTTSFVGRDLEVKQLAGLVRAHRLVTLTGVGGVGKTRLAVQVAAGMSGEFPDGVWLVELAPLGDPAAVPDAVATALGIAPHPGLSVVDSVVEALAGRQLLVVLDNCEHVLDAAAELVEAVLARTVSVKVLATSREGLRVGAEQLWVVPSLGLDGPTSEAAALFEARAVAVNARFSLDDPDIAAAVTVICRRLDGIPLAIELAAARMVSMSARDVQDRLGDRFRLLAGGRRGLERHQTLRQAVAWSFDLLDQNETLVLHRCAVFAGGFSLAAATVLCQPLDEYVVLDVLDALVRKSLVTVEEVFGHARYGLFETIRQFAEEQLAATGDVAEFRDAHARYFAAQAVRYCDIWDGPGQREALDWVDVEFANLRAGFRWAADHHDLEAAAAIAAHTTLMNNTLQRHESIGWAVELLDAATRADVPQLPRLYYAAGLCFYLGQPEDTVALRPDGASPWRPTLATTGSDPLAAQRWRRPVTPTPVGSSKPSRSAWRRPPVRGRLTWRVWPSCVGCSQRLDATRRPERWPRRPSPKTASPPATPTPTPTWLPWCSPTAMAWPTLEATRSAPWAPFARCWSTAGNAGLSARRGRSRTTWQGSKPATATPTRRWICSISPSTGFHRAGVQGNLGLALGSLAVHFDRVEQPEPAARIYGAGTHSLNITVVPGLQEAVQHLRKVLGGPVFDRYVAAGAAMETGDAVAYAREQIRLARTNPDTTVAR